MPETCDCKREKIGSLGSNLDRIFREKSVEIANAVLSPLEVKYNDGDKIVTLHFLVRRSDIRVTKTIHLSRFMEDEVSIVLISKQDFAENFPGIILPLTIAKKAHQKKQKAKKAFGLSREQAQIRPSHGQR